MAVKPQLRKVKAKSTMRAKAAPPVEAEISGFIAHSSLAV